MAKGGNGKGNGGGGGGDGGGGGSYTSWVYFGDSLTDNGDFYAIAQTILIDPYPLASEGYAGVFSNGDVYADVAMDLAGVAEADYQNYALGSARSLGSRTVGELMAERTPVTAYDLGDGTTFTYDPVKSDYDGSYDSFDINLSAQVDRYLAANPAVDAGTTASLLIGANDIAAFEADWWDFLFGDPVGDYADDIADVIHAQSLRLVQAGVDRIVLNTLPIAAFFPIFALGDSTQQDIGDDLVNATNSEILQRAQQLDSAGATVEVIRFDYLSRQIEDDGITFGFIDVDAPYLLGTGGDPTYYGDAEAGTASPTFEVNPAVAGFDLDQVAFFDYLHPTAALHGVMGIFQHESLNSKTLLLGDSGSNTRLKNADDMAWGGGGADTLHLSGGNDVGFGGLGNDTVYGGGGSDILAGASGDDSLLGGSGQDVVAGGAGNDRIEGGAEADILIDGLGSDIAIGGTGDDVFIYVDGAFMGGSTAGDADIFLGGDGSDMAYLVLTDAVKAEAEWLAGQPFSDFSLSLDSIETVTFLDERGDLNTLAFEGDLGERYAEAQLWALV